jgi:hypothetical protein
MCSDYDIRGEEKPHFHADTGYNLGGGKNTQRYYKDESLGKNIAVLCSSE